VKCSRKPHQGAKPLLAEPLAKILHLSCLDDYFQIPAKIGVFQQNGLLAAVNRIAAILPNDLAPTNMNGP